MVMMLLVVGVPTLVAMPVVLLLQRFLGGKHAFFSSITVEQVHLTGGGTAALSNPSPAPFFS